ncbi:MAG: hypothetical protein EXR39_15455 [Betaproteobacteria bacterium]|nr:hypothetical protein [Betaproteobacteria bacterium]
MDSRIRAIAPAIRNGFSKLIGQRQQVIRAVANGTQRTLAGARGQGHRRERAGYIRANQVKRLTLAQSELPELLAIIRYLRQASGSEALGIDFASAYIQTASAKTLNSEDGIEVLDALGLFADRLAERASAPTKLGKSARLAVAAHLEVAHRHGVKFITHKQDGGVRMCYDGDAFRRTLALSSTPEQRAAAALGLTRPECVADETRVMERRQLDEWRANVLDHVEPGTLPPYLKNRVRTRRAAIWASLAYQRTRSGLQIGESADAEAAAQRALTELAGVNKLELADDDLSAYRDAAMRVNASRWAAGPSIAPIAPGNGPREKYRPRVVTVFGEPGETCIHVVDGHADRPLAKRCTYGIAWVGSATVNREGTAVAIAVQSAEAWRELWVFHRMDNDWTVRVMPPAAAMPGIGYAEFAGWRPGGAQMLVAREAVGEGKYLRSFELVRVDTLAPVRQASDPDLIDAFKRWQDPLWKQQTVSLR